MKLRTELTGKFIGGIDHSSSLLMLGSCFTDEIGHRLAAHGFNAVVNPTGTLYNPLSIAATIRNLQAQRTYHADELIENQGLWRSFDHHSRLAHNDRSQALKLINDSMATGYDALAKATHVIITFGTAYVFEHAGRVVCNCHKLPAGQFTRRRLDIEEITDIWRRIIDYYPDKKFIFTVSPIRHTADGLHGNQLSKATLHLAIDSLGAEYFPAYEALVDDLRDYRFYADDLVHPSPMAVSYVYDRFASTYFSPSTQAEAAIRHKAYLRSSHRTLHSV